MEIAIRCTRLPGILCAAALVLFLAACSDQQPTAPQYPKLKLAESRGPVTVSSVITLYDRSGKTQTFTKVQRLLPVVRNGVAFSMVITDSSEQAAGVPSGTLTPILAVQTGTMVGNYNEIVTDTTTMKNYRVVATGPMLYNYPIDHGYVASSTGVKVNEIYYKWQAVTGGYALLAQKEVTYTPTGALFATAVSTVTSPVTYAMADRPPSISRQIGSLLYGAVCYFLPQTAYAQGRKGGGSGPIVQPYNLPLPGSSCWVEGAELGVAAAAVWVDASNPEVGLFAFSATLGYFEANFANYLKCLNKPPRCVMWVTCTGGGGSSW